MNKLNHSIQLIQTDRANIFNVKLKLNGTSRLIGVLDLSGEGTFLAIRSEKHLFRKNNSLGINYELLTASHIKFKWIVIDFCYQKLVSTREYFLQKGKALKFNKQGYELQVFVPIDDMKIQIAREFEEKQQRGFILLDLFNEVA